VERPKQPHPRQSPSLQGLVSSSQSAESADSSDTPTTLRELELEPLSISQPSWSTWLLRFWSWLATRPRTTRKQELCLDTSCWQSETTKNSTNCCTMLPLLREVCSPTSVALFQEPNKAAGNHLRQFDLYVLIASLYTK